MISVPTKQTGSRGLRVVASFEDLTLSVWSPYTEGVSV